MLPLKSFFCKQYLTRNIAMKADPDPETECERNAELPYRMASIRYNLKLIMFNGCRPRGEWRS